MGIKVNITKINGHKNKNYTVGVLFLLAELADEKCY